MIKILEEVAVVVRQFDTRRLSSDVLDVLTRSKSSSVLMSIP